MFDYKTKNCVVIEVRSSRSHGLEVWQVLVNGTLLNTCLSEQMARSKAKAYTQRWMQK